MIWFFILFHTPKITIYDIEGMQSPVDFLFSGGQIYLSGDYWELKPGIYKAEMQAGFRTLKADLFIPVFMMDPASIWQEDTNWWLLSCRDMDKQPSNWKSRLVQVNESIYPVESHPLPDGVICSDGSSRCGFSTVLVQNKQVFALKRVPSKFYVLEKNKDIYEPIIEKYAEYEGKQFTPQSLRSIEQEFWVLAQDRWLILGCAKDVVMGGGSQRLPFDMRVNLLWLKDLFPHGNEEMNRSGYLEAFQKTEDGSIWVLINNRGQSFQFTPNAKLKTSKLIRIHPPTP